MIIVPNYFCQVTILEGSETIDDVFKPTMSKPLIILIIIDYKPISLKYYIELSNGLKNSKK